MSENLKLIGKKLVLDDPELWKVIRELRNDVHHEYEHDPEILFQFFNNLVKHVPVLLGIHDRLKMFVERTYGSSLSTE